MKFAPVFASCCVLQRRKPIAVWGTEEKAATVTVSLGEVSASAAVENGKWMVKLPAMEAAAGLTLTAKNDLDEEIVLTDVAVGEVWIGAGQSNMEFLLMCDADRAEVLETVNEPNIRFYEVPKVSYEGQLENEDHSSEGVWRKALPGDVGYFSAVGFYFSRKIREKIGDVPVAVLGCNWGGSSAAAWLAEEYLTDELDYYMELNRTAAAVDSLEEDFAKFREQGKQSHSPEAVAGMMKFMSNEIKGPLNFPMDEERMKYFRRTKYAPYSQFRSCGIYHTMLETVMPYTCAGVIWYQGEEDAAKAEMYCRLYAQMVRCWRDKWGEELPFIQAQLAAYNPGKGREDLDFTEIRAVQEYITKVVPGVYHVVTFDVGSEFDIHPKRKKPVGERMGLQALSHVYGVDVECESPEVVSAAKENGEITIRFLHSVDGLYVEGETAEGFAVLVNGQKTDPKIEVYEDVVSILSDAITEDARVEVNYCQICYCKANLYNSVNLPVRPFKVVL